MRIPIAAGNWKMNFGPNQARQFAALLRDPLQAITGVETILFPPAIALSAVHQVIANTPIDLGAQNLSDQSGGAFTGEISGSMIAELCHWVIVGHSDRRHLYGETDGLVNHKTLAALNAGLFPIVCVGEQLADRDTGRTQEVITAQVRGSLGNLPTDLIDRVVVAYEPVWAIGSGRSATRADAEAVTQTIRALVAELYGSAVESALRVLYGGSVSAANITEFAASPLIDGALVGGASLKPEFVDIAKAIAAAKAG